MNKLKDCQNEIKFLFQSFQLPILANRKYFIIGVIMVLCAGLAQVSLPYLLGRFIDVLSGKTVKENILLSFGLLFAAFFLNTLFNLIKNYCFLMFAEKATIEIIKMLFSRIIRYPISFFDNTQIGSLASRLNNDIQSLKRLFSEQVAQLIYHPLIIIICLSNLFVINLKLTLLLLLTFPFILRASSLLGKRIKVISKETYDCYAKANQILTEDFMLIRVIKSYCSEGREDERFHHIMSEIRKKTVAASFAGILLQFAISCLLLTGLFLIMLYAIHLIKQSEITAGRLFEFITCTIFITNAISSISATFASIMNTLSIANTLRKLIDIKEENYLGHSIPDSFHEIQLSDVYFAYETRPISVLNNINFTIHKGDRIGIIGESGGGKSTLVQLLLRFYHPISGHILIDGKDITTLSLKDYRNLFGVVSQNIELFAGSIKDNIMYPTTDTSDGEIISASQLACSHDFIMNLPDRYDTTIGENGVSLSGGQRQRITIARALIRKPKIIILDEGTSALDPKTEESISAFFTEISRDITLIVLSHRKSIISKMDKVYEIKNKNMREV